MIIPRPADPEFDDEYHDRDRHNRDTSISPSSIEDVQFWIDHPSLDDLTAAQTESDRQQVRRDVEECIRLLNASTRRFQMSGQDNESSIRQVPYSVVGVLGVGAFGVVLHARDEVLNRDVAIKILRPSVFLSKEARIRFTLEGEALARCNCPGIVPIHEVGNIDGHPYLVMGLVRGITLADFMKAQLTPVAPRIAACIVSEIALAVHRAHQRGILHRDLKPSNVLLQQKPESQSELPFTPFVSDFGLAKDLLPDSKHALSHATADTPIIGTVRYMSPEQATGRNQDISVTSDVFSLGVVLYELLTLECPFKGTTTFEIIQQVATVSAKLPRQLNAKIPRELNAIVGCCLSKDPEGRYPSASDLAEDLQRFLEGKPVVAKPAGPLKATFFWAKRNPGLAVAASIIWCGLFISTVTISLLYRENLKNLQKAHDATLREEMSRRFALTSIDKTLRYMAETTLQNVPQTQEKKLDLHLVALKTNEEYAALRGHDDESMYRLSISHHYVANDAFNCQQFELSSFHRVRCLEIVGRLAEKDPKNSDYQFDIFMNRFLTQSSQMSSEEYLAWLIQTREYLQSAIKLSSYNPDYEEADAATCVTIGHAVFECDRGNPREWFAIAIDKLPELAKRYPDRPKYYKHAISGHQGMARVDLDDQNWDSASKHCEQALELIEKHFRKSKDVADILFHSLTTLEYYAVALEHMDKVKAIEIYGQYIAISTELENREPQFQFYQMRRARAFLSQAKLHHQLGEMASSQIALAKASQTLEGYKPALESNAVELSQVVSGIAELKKLLEPSS